MKRSKGTGGQIMAFLMFCLMAAIVIAVLRQFDWDLIEAIGWIFSSIAEFISRIADKFTEMPGFRRLVN